MTLTFQMAQSTPAGVYFALSPTSGLNGFGCGINLPGYGEVLVGLAPLPELLPIGIYAGTALPFSFQIPSDPTLIGVTVFSQGMFIDPTNLAEQVRLTNGLKLTIGL